MVYSGVEICNTNSSSMEGISHTDSHWTLPDAPLCEGIFVVQPELAHISETLSVVGRLHARANRKRKHEQHEDDDGAADGRLTMVHQHMYDLLHQRELLDAIWRGDLSRRCIRRHNQWQQKIKDHSDNHDLLHLHHVLMMSAEIIFLSLVDIILYVPRIHTAVFAQQMKGSTSDCNVYECGCCARLR